uniref:Uncharacterized protein n=1 Tax=Pipistrellus kuhlii TaxID=59472 RepID=A0A7J7U810_PIPKU|nr:hypothetical protein mPipKuh1_009187 [Pipistrellus kuhlii]
MPVLTPLSSPGGWSPCRSPSPTHECLGPCPGSRAPADPVLNLLAGFPRCQRRGGQGKARGPALASGSGTALPHRAHGRASCLSARSSSLSSKPPLLVPSVPGGGCPKTHPVGPRRRALRARHRASLAWQDGAGPALAAWTLRDGSRNP